MILYDQWQSLTRAQRDKFKEQNDTIPERDIERQFQESLDECTAPYVIGELTFPASDVLANCDPVAYQCAYSDYIGTSDDIIDLDGEYYTSSDLEDWIANSEEVENG